MKKMFPDMQVLQKLTSYTLAQKTTWGCAPSNKGVNIEKKLWDPGSEIKKKHDRDA